MGWVPLFHLQQALSWILTGLKHSVSLLEPFDIYYAAPNTTVRHHNNRPQRRWQNESCTVVLYCIQ
jgi:hypothetical protein